MEKYSDLYKKHLESLWALERSLMDSIVIAIKTISVEPLKIGNMEYFYVNEDGKDVPAYRYKDSGDNFKPIYDYQGLCEYGWANFNECCKIFDVIRYTLFNKLKK